MSLDSGEIVFFEPWSLGDVIIAAATLRELAEPATLACHSSWHSLLRATLRDILNLSLIAVDLPYTTRKRASPFDSHPEATDSQAYSASRLLSIRGDLRDWIAARKLFPKAKIRMTGWARFFGRKSAMVNFPYRIGLLPVTNRYRSWARLAGVDYAKIAATYRQRQMELLISNSVVIHVGAQWRSKQFPEVAALRDMLQSHRYTVRIVAGPGDPLPPGLEEKDISRAADAVLVEALLSAGYVITNDSGPMHLAAYLGCRTTAVVRTSPIEEWIPPATTIVRSPLTPRGYRPNRRYMSDEILTGWPRIEEVIRTMETKGFSPEVTE
ncbi:MAG: hypothetical protein H0X40_07055 [Chthoniobacterales bacterium]|nr:hypothetical protein [Chthoniobacterales bacterium]